MGAEGVEARQRHHRAVQQRLGDAAGELLLERPIVRRLCGLNALQEVRSRGEGRSAGAGVRGGGGVDKLKHFAAGELDEGALNHPHGAAVKECSIGADVADKELEGEGVVVHLTVEGGHAGVVDAVGDGEVLRTTEAHREQQTAICGLLAEVLVFLLLRLSCCCGSVLVLILLLANIDRIRRQRRRNDGAGGCGGEHRNELRNNYINFWGGQVKHILNRSGAASGG